MTVLAEVHDPDGHRVELTAKRWGHILDEHPEMSEHHDAVLATVAAPSIVARIRVLSGCATGVGGSGPVAGSWRS